MGLLKDFILLFYRDKTAKIFALATILGLSLSMTIVMSTLGLMDGFVGKLQGALNAGHGEIVLSGKKGFFYESANEIKQVNDLGISDISFQVRTQAFSLVGDKGKAVIALGIDQDFRKINESQILPKEGEIVIGQGLATFLGLNAGDSVSLTFAAGRSGDTYLPTSATFKIISVKEFKIHNYNERFVYVNKTQLQKILDIGKLVNVAKIKVPDSKNSKADIEALVFDLTNILYNQFNVVPFWSEFNYLIEAVNYEKYMISIVLFVVVVVAAFNCLSFVIYSKEKRSQEIFLLYAVGLSPRKFKNLWIVQNFLIWLVSLAISYVLVLFVGHAIATWDIFKLPIEVYHLGQLEVDLNLRDFLYVALSSLFLLMFMTYLVLKKIGAKSLAAGLRQEF